MKRAEKIALLTKVIQGDLPAIRLQQFIEAAPRSLIIIDDFGSGDSQPIGNKDPVSFYNRGKEHTMPLNEVHQYARRQQIRMLVVAPA
jgi:hypothetical protein